MGVAIDVGGGLPPAAPGGGMPSGGAGLSAGLPQDSMDFAQLTAALTAAEKRGDKVNADKFRAIIAGAGTSHEGLARYGDIENVDFSGKPNLPAVARSSAPAANTSHEGLARYNAIPDVNFSGVPNTFTGGPVTPDAPYLTTPDVDVLPAPPVPSAPGAPSMDALPAQAGITDTPIPAELTPAEDEDAMFPAPAARANVKPTSTIGDPGTGDDGTGYSLWTGVFGKGGTGWGGIKDNWKAMDPDKKRSIYEMMIAGGGAMMTTPGNFGEGLGAGMQAGLGAYNADENQRMAQDKAGREGRSADLRYQAETARLQLAMQQLNDPTLNETQKLESQAAYLSAKKRLEQLQSGGVSLDDRYGEDRAQYMRYVDDRMREILADVPRINGQIPPSITEQVREQAMSEADRAFYGSAGKAAPSEF